MTSHPEFPRFRAQGDAAVMVHLGRGIDPHLGRAVRALADRLTGRPAPGQREVMPGYATVQVQFDPLVTDHAEVEDHVRGVLAGLPPAAEHSPRVVEVPVVYGGEHGPDLEFLERHTGLAASEIIERHTAPLYPCYLVGFTPGFPFLGGLDPALAAPRLDSPRAGLLPGAVGIAGQQTGLYPLGGPGGWRIMGRTPLMVFNPLAEPPALILPGDLVRFTAVEDAAFPLPPVADQPWDPTGRSVWEVLTPGCATVQDAGRWGRQNLGVPMAGALDQAALRAANRLVGNPPDAAGLELTLLGPRLKALTPLTLALCGADLGASLDGRALPRDRAVKMEPGQILAFRGPRDGSRAFLAVAGGLAAPLILGSRATYPLGLMGGPLAPGQVLSALPPAGPPAHGPLPAELAPRPPRGVLLLRATAAPNPEFFGEAGRRALFGTVWKLSPRSDRRGVRLTGGQVPLAPGVPTSIVSEPNAPGIVQVPADGQPIILLRDQTTGGYAKAATVIGPDLDLLARALPGQEVALTEVTPPEAVAAARDYAAREAAWA
ncbi:MAG: 5-oxoprolinase subunit PxpB [Deltaproteobacteria bacterium]|nr:5-oxoprolinase subunit PxpB [Deltaproteobacteria bacterium]